MGVRIIVDSTADIKKEIKDKFLIVPLSVNFGEESYEDGVEIDADTFYKKLIGGKIMPTTSQPTPDKFAEMYQKVVSAGDEAVVLTISSKLSGTFQSANIAAEDFEGKIFVVDTKAVTICAGVIAEYALQLAESGKTASEIKEIIDEEKDNVVLYAVLDTLEYLKRGGRISKTAALAGGLLNVKPVIDVSDGEVHSVTKGRGIKQATLLMNAEIEKKGVNLEKPFLAGYTGCEDTLMQAYLDEHFDMWGGDREAIGVAQIGSVVGTHAGPDAFAMAYFIK